MKPTSSQIGRHAEDIAAQYLLNREYAIVERNWRTRYCEIDLIARRFQTIYFVEVKYRRNNQQGSGLDYVTPFKRKRMAFAAQLWMHNHPWEHGNFSLAAIEVSGPGFDITNYLTLV